ncbi:MAG: hypothetical protein ACREBM_02855, partial [Sphingomicrobium sp.]
MLPLPHGHYSASGRRMEDPRLAVAKLIQDGDNFLGWWRKALPALQRITYHKVQFGKVAFAVPQ